MKWKGRLAFLSMAPLVGIWLAGNAVASAKSTVPSLGPMTPVVLPDQPKAVEDITTDSSGNLYLLDRAGCRVLVYSRDLRHIRTIGAPGAGPGRLSMPLRLSVNGSLLAIVDDNQRVHLFGAEDGAYVRSVGRLMNYEPGPGFFLTRNRFLFASMGYDREVPSEDRPADIMLLFSTDLAGKDLKVQERVTVLPEKAAVFNIHCSAYATRCWDGLYAVTRSIPRQVFLVDDDARVTRKGDRQPNTLPTEPYEAMGDASLYWEVFLHHPHVEGLFSTGNSLGVIWRLPKPGGSFFRVEWLAKDLRPYGESILPLPGRFGPREGLFRTAANGKGDLYFLVVHRQAFGLGSSDLYTCKILHP